MQRSSDPGFLVLHALRLKGFADLPAIATTARLGEDETLKHLEAAAEADLVTQRSGRISGWALTAAGRQRHRERIAEELSSSGAREAVGVGYAQFLTFNTELLEVCTAWQVRDGSLNDHRDARYDGEVVARLGGVDDGDWFTKPMIDSYHTVWFELHEDLLATLGIERSKEAGA